MKVRLGTLRRLVREALVREYGDAASASGTDPTDVKGFYPYEIERGSDIHGFWYRSPGRGMGADGDPFRPADAAAYIGMKPPSEAEEANDVESEEGSESSGKAGPPSEEAGVELASEEE